MKVLIKPHPAILILFLLFSCHPKGTTKYVLVNETSHSIQIKAYQRISKFENGAPVFNKTLFAETINIQGYSSYSSTEYHAFSSGNRQRVFQRSNVDSVSIVFNGNRILEQYCNGAFGLEFCDVEHNIMDISNNYKMVRLSKDDIQYTFYFTEKDYVNARLIEKN